MKIVNISLATTSNNPVYKIQKPVKIGSKVQEIFNPKNPKKRTIVEYWLSELRKDGDMILQQSLNPYIRKE